MASSGTCPIIVETVGNVWCLGCIIIVCFTALEHSNSPAVSVKNECREEKNVENAYSKECIEYETTFILRTAYSVQGHKRGEERRMKNTKQCIYEIS